MGKKTKIKQKKKSCKTQCKLRPTYHSSPVCTQAGLKEESLLYTQNNSPGKEHLDFFSLLYGKEQMEGEKQTSHVKLSQSCKVKGKDVYKQQICKTVNLYCFSLSYINKILLQNELTVKCLAL